MLRVVALSLVALQVRAAPRGPAHISLESDSAPWEHVMERLAGMEQTIQSQAATIDKLKRQMRAHKGGVVGANFELLEGQREYVLSQ
tara:strand:+ start:92 stop:352 length:261 start_codon:yes stop_codon:yes gene_type:complete